MGTDVTEDGRPPTVLPPDAGGPPARTSKWAVGSTLVGLILLASAGVIGIYLTRHHGIDGLDRWGLSAIPAEYHSKVLDALAEAGNPLVVGMGALLGAATLVGRDRARALACLVGAALAGALAELLIKPWVDARTGSGFAYPSGHTTGVGALAADAVLVVAPRWRWVVAFLGTLLAVAVSGAVVALGWHSPTDAVGGAALGCGSVLLADGILHLWSPTGGRPLGLIERSGPRHLASTERGANRAERYQGSGPGPVCWENHPQSRGRPDRTAQLAPTYLES